MPRKKSQLSRLSAAAKRMRLMRRNEKLNEKVHRLANQRVINKENRDRELSAKRLQRLALQRSRTLASRERETSAERLQRLAAQRARTLANRERESSSERLLRLAKQRARSVINRARKKLDLLNSAFNYECNLDYTVLNDADVGSVDKIYDWKTEAPDGISYETSLIGDNSQMNFHSFKEGNESDFYVSQVINLADDLEPMPKREKSFSSSYNQQTEGQSTVEMNNHYDKMPRYQVSSSFDSSSNHDNHVPQISSSLAQSRPSSKSAQNSILPIAISQITMHSRELTAPLHTSQMATSFEEQPKSILPNNADTDPIQSNEPSTTQLIPNVVKDECSTYGDYVACKLRCYPEKTKNLVQHYINNIIFEADMGKLC